MFKKMHSFDSYGAFLECAARVSRESGICQSAPREAWDFSAGFDGALELARKGWPEGAAKVRAIADKLLSLVAPMLANSGLEYRDDGGPLLDVGRYCEGEPEHYLEFAPEPARKPVTLVVHPGARYKASAEQMFNRGAAVLAAAEILAARGFVVTIECSNTCTFDDKQRGPRYTYTHPVHTAGDAMDADTLAFVCTHPAYHRRLGLAAREMLWTAQAMEDGHGASCNPPTIPAGIYTGPIVNDTDFATDTAAAARALEICKQAGCEIAEV